MLVQIAHLRAGVFAKASRGIEEDVGEGMDWMMRNIVSVLAGSVRIGRFWTQGISATACRRNSGGV